MKKKIIIASASVLFAVASVLNINMLQSGKPSDVSLESIAVMAQAQNEGLTNEEFTEMTGCIAVIHKSSCVGKDGKTYSYAEPR